MDRYSRPVQAIVSLLQAPFDVEWTENPLSWPHCNAQGGCWMHMTIDPWCGCTCRWCRVARTVRR